MRVATFLDVDGVLNAKAINLQYAQLLGVQGKLASLEQRYANRQIDNDQFNAVFVPLFREAGFSRQFAKDNFDNIQLRINTEQLLSATPDTFVVTSGPSYFIDILVERYKLKPDNVLCSRYEFDQKELLQRCVSPVTSTMKGTFVRERVAQFEVAVGVGDTDQDIEFLGHCGIRVLMGGNRTEYFSARELQPIVDVIKNLQVAADPGGKKFETSLSRLYQHSPYNRNVFIMTPFRSGAAFRETIQSIRDALEELGLKAWLAADLELESQLWDNVQVFLAGCKAGIAVFTHDEVLPKREGSDAVFNPNVSIEVGHMLAHRKPVLLLKDKRLNRLPTDMVGSLYYDFDLDEAPSTIRSAVNRWVKSKDLV